MDLEMLPLVFLPPQQFDDPPEMPRLPESAFFLLVSISEALQFDVQIIKFVRPVEFVFARHGWVFT
jgi:hypothetical protein